MVFCSYRVKLKATTEEAFNKVKSLLNKAPFQIKTEDKVVDDNSTGVVQRRQGGFIIEENYQLDTANKVLELRAETDSYKSLKKVKVVDYYHIDGCYVDISIEYDSESVNGDEFLQSNLRELSDLIAG